MLLNQQINSLFDEVAGRTTSEEQEGVLVGTVTKAVLKQGSVAPGVSLPVIASRRRISLSYAMSLRALKGRNNLLNDKFASSPNGSSQ